MSKRARKRVTKEMRVAYHEAGHAVLTFNLTRVPRVRYVTTLPDKDDNSLGHCSHQPTKRFREWAEGGDDQTAGVLRAIEEGLVLLAGPEAERALTGRYNHRGAISDYQQLARFLFAWCGDDEDEATALSRWLEKRCARLVRRHWREVEVVAQALLEHKKLTGQKVKAIIYAERQRAFDAWRKRHSRAGPAG